MGGGISPNPIFSTVTKRACRVSRAQTNGVTLSVWVLRSTAWSRQMRRNMGRNIRTCQAVHSFATAAAAVPAVPAVPAVAAAVEAEAEAAEEAGETE